ncbi:MAG: hypothetical protein ACFFAN_11055 [Promethearchaeota archaeon]
MKKKCRLLIILNLLIVSCITFLYYYFTKQFYELGSFEIIISLIIPVIFFNLFFFALIFLFEINYFKHVFKSILIFVALISVIYSTFKFYLEFFKVEKKVPWYIGNLWELNIILSFSLIAPGLILYLIDLIIKKTAKHNDVALKGKYHVHEGFVGILSLLIAILFIIFRNILVKYGRFHTFFKVLLALNQIVLFLTLFFGSFLILRDWHDIVQFKFVEVKDNLDNLNVKNYQKNQSSLFNHISQENLYFFESPKLAIYIIGIVLINIAMNLIVYGSGLLTKEHFNLKNEPLIFLGYLFCLIGGGMIGKDWVRIFKRISPNIYQEIEMAINRLKNKNV